MPPRNLCPTSRTYRSHAVVRVPGPNSYVGPARRSPSGLDPMDSMDTVLLGDVGIATGVRCRVVEPLSLT